MRKTEAVFALFLVFLASSLASGVQQASLIQERHAEEMHRAGVIAKRSMQAGVVDCLWDGASCSLRKDFVTGLPGVLGSPTTESAKILADAALRAAICSNFTGKPECLDGSSYSCEWDTVLSRCSLADLLNSTMLRGVAYCPGSRLDIAMSCLSLSASACASNPTYNCTLLDGIQLPSLPGGSSSNVGAGTGFASMVGDLGDRQLSAMMNSLLGAMAKYGMAGIADPITELIAGLLQQASGPASGVKVCGASWMADSVFLSSLGGIVTKAIKADRDLLSAILSSTDLAGSCNGTLPLLAAATACAGASAGGAAACAATAGGCEWLAAVNACSLGPDALPSLALDPSDRWVTVLNNATSICRSFADVGSCGSAINLAAGLEKGSSATKSGGGGGTVAAASWWLLAAAAAAAVALGDTVRRV